MEAPADGGGIYNDGTLTVSNSTFAGNSASSGSGGGIYNHGTVTVSNSTFSGNSAGSRRRRRRHLQRAAR